MNQTQLPEDRGQRLADEAMKQVGRLLKESLSPDYHFHAFQHSLNVRKSVMTIGEAMGFSGDEMIQAEISALFHDTGYVEGWKDHELRSARMAREFLKNAGIGEPLIHTVQNAILATHVPQSPTDRIGEALCDADLCHLAGEDYFEQMELLRLEWADSGQRDLSELDFHRNSVVFFGKHRYHSDYGKMVLGPMKMKNLDRIQERIRELEQAES